MTINEFNGKVNLPELCINKNLNDYQFVKLPTFGWFAYNHNKSVICSTYDIVKQTDTTSVYKHFTIIQPEYQDLKFSYSETAENRFLTDYNFYILWRKIWMMARYEAENSKINYGGRYIKLKELCIELGYPYLLESGIGLITETVINSPEGKLISWPQYSKNKLLIPTYCTPRHICSLELASIVDLDNRHTIYLNGEKGWYGTLNKRIVSNIKEALTLGGNTWDTKCDYWQTSIITLSNTLTLQDCIKIWTEARKTLFDKSPLDIVVETQHIDEIKKHICKLSYDQIQEIENKTGESLLGYWKQAREREITIDYMKFVERKNRYCLWKKGDLSEYTNFTMTIDKIKKRRRMFYRSGHIFYKEHVVAFEFPESAFSSPKKLIRRLKEFFFDNALGLPTVLTNQQHYLLDVINQFNPDISIDTTS